MADDTPTPSEIRAQRNIERAQRRVDNAQLDYLTAILRPIDGDGDGRVTKTEAIQFLGDELPVLATNALAPERARRRFTISDRMEIGEDGVKRSGDMQAEPASFLTEDRTLFSAEDMAQRLHHSPRFKDLDIARVRDAVRRAFPRGVEEVTLGDAGEHNASLGCLPLQNSVNAQHPHGQVMVFNGPPSRT